MWGGMKASFPNQSACLRIPASYLHSAASTRGKRLLFSAIVCSLPARDVEIDFGKYKGCKLGTLPSRYLQWLVRESHQHSLAAWGDYAQQVLQDPYYQDRLEWQRIEKQLARGDMGKGGPLGFSAGAKGSMIALGWDLSDSKAWSNVNFSLLGTTQGGRIPRKEPTASSFSAATKPLTGSCSTKSLLRRLSQSKLDASLSNAKAAIEAGASAVPSVSKFSKGNPDGSLSSLKATQIKTVEISQPSLVNPTVGTTQPSKSLTLQEEVLRRRQLRRERSTQKSLITLPPSTDKVHNLFPGRESLLRRVRKNVETEFQ